MTKPAANQPADPRDLRGDGRYGFTVRVEGDDLVARDVRATWFGGASDPLDDGRTASGLSTRRDPEILGCALPMNGFRATRGSPLPNLPWCTTVVEVYCPSTGKRAAVPLIDLGPSAPPLAHAAIDLTPAAFRALGGNRRVGRLTVDFRIPGGASHLPASLLSAARAAQRADQTTASAPRAAIPAVRPPKEPGDARPSATPAPPPAAAHPASAATETRARVAGAATPAAAAASGGVATGLAGPAAPPARGKAVVHKLRV